MAIDKKIKGITIELDGDTKKLNDSFSGIDQKAKEIGASLKLVNEQLKLDPKNAEAAAQKLVLLQQKAANTSEKLETLKSVQGQIQQQYRDGVIDESQWVAFQTELAKTENQLNSTYRQIERLSGTGNDIEKVKKPMEETATVSDTLSGAFKKVSVVGAAAGAAVSAVGAFCAESAKKIKELADQSAAAGDKIDKQSQRLGMSAQAYQEWDFILSQNGGSVDILSTGVNKLNNLLDDARNGSKSATETFSKLGLSFEELNAMNSEQRFEAIIAALQGMENVSERNAVANDILGKSYVDIIPLLNSTAEGTEELKNRAHETGMIMSDEAVSAAVHYTDAMDVLNRTVTGLTNEFGAKLLPGLTEVAQGITDMASGVEGGSERVANGIEMMVGAFSDAAPDIIDIITQMAEDGEDIAPEMIETIISAILDLLPHLAVTAQNIIPALLEGIIAALPELGEGAGEIVAGLLTAIIELLPMLSDGAIQMVLALVQGISNSVPELIPAAVKAADAFIKGVLNMLPTIIDVAMELIIALYNGIIAALPELVKVCPTLMIRLASALINAIPKLLEAIPKIQSAITEALTSIDWIETGKEMIASLLNALLQAVDSAKNAFLSLGQTVFGYLFGDGGDGSGASYSGSYSGGGKVGKVDVADNTAAMSGYKEAIDGEIETIEAATADLETAGEQAEETIEDTGEGLSEALDSLDHMLATHKISEADYWKRRKEVLEKYRDEESEEWWKEYDKVTDYYNKLAETERKAAEKAEKERQKQAKAEQKQREEEQKKKQKAAEDAAKKVQKAAEELAKAQKKAAEERKKEAVKAAESEIDAIYDTYEAKYKELEKLKENAYKKFMSIGGNVFSYSKDDEGNVSMTIEDIKQQMKKMEDFYADIKNLKDSGASQSLISEILAMNEEEAANWADYLAEMNSDEFETMNALYKKKEQYAKDLADMLYAEDESALGEDLKKELSEYVNGSEDANTYADDFIAALLERDSDFRKAFDDILGGNIADILTKSGYITLPKVGDVSVPTVNDSTNTAKSTAGAGTETKSAVTASQADTGAAVSPDYSVILADIYNLLSDNYNLLSDIYGKIESLKITVNTQLTLDGAIVAIAKKVTALQKSEKRITNG